MSRHRVRDRSCRAGLGSKKKARWIWLLHINRKGAYQKSVLRKALRSEPRNWQLSADVHREVVVVDAGLATQSEVGDFQELECRIQPETTLSKNTDFY